MSYILPVTSGGSGSGNCAPVVNVNQTNNCADGGTGTPGTGGDTKDPSARVSIAGALKYAFDVLSAAKISTGIFRIVTTPTFETVVIDGENQVQCAVEITPEGELQDPLAALVTEHFGLSSTSHGANDIQLYNDNDLGEIFIIDSQHSTVASVAYDRLAIFNRFTRAWNYIYFEGEDHDDVYHSAGTPLLYDPVSKKAFVLLFDSVNNRIATLVFDMVGRQKVFNTWTDISGHTQTQFHYILQINPANSTCLILGDSNSLRWYNTVDGLPNGAFVDELASFAGINTVGMAPRIDINNNYWAYKNTGGSNQWWVRTFLTGSTITFEEISISTDQAANVPNPTTVKPSTNCFYYMSGNLDYLMKFDCTAKTATRVNATAYATLTTGNRHLTLKGINSLTWSSDYSTLIAVRTPSSQPGDILVIDPVDGTILSNVNLVDKYTRNFSIGIAAIDVGTLFSVSSQRLMQVDFSGAENLDTILTTKTIGAKYFWIDGNEVQVELRDNITGARIDSAFSIAFHSPGTAAGGGGGGTVTGEADHLLVLPFAFGDATPALIGSVVANRQILSVRVIISTAFNGTGAALSVGTAGTPADLMATTENNPAEVAEYTVYTQKSYVAATSLYLHITPGSGASAGAGVVIIEFQSQP